MVVNYHLQWHAIKGNSTDSKHKNQIERTSGNLTQPGQPEKPVSTALLLLLALGLPAAFAQPVSVAPWMTGQRLVELAAWPAGARNNFDLTPQQYTDQQLVKMYVEGVHDATEGKGWCYSQTHKPKPGTLQDQAIAGLRTMSPEQLKRAAADLIVEAWRAKYPCTADRSRP